MAVATPYSGFNATCTVTPSGGGAVVIPGTDWTLSDDAKVKDCNNFRDGRLRFKTLNDSNFSATLIWDTNLIPNSVGGGGLKAGDTVAIAFAVAAGKSFTGSFILTTVEVSNPGMEDVVMYKVSGVLSASTTPLTSVTYPT